MSYKILKFGVEGIFGGVSTVVFFNFGSALGNPISLRTKYLLQLFIFMSEVSVRDIRIQELVKKTEFMLTQTINI